MLLGGGGFHLALCQLVLCIFYYLFLSCTSKWSILSSSLSEMFSSKITNGSLMNKWLKCFDRTGSILFVISKLYISLFIGTIMSLYFCIFLDGFIKQSTLLYLGLGIYCSPSFYTIIILFTKSLFVLSPIVLSSTDWEMTSHLLSRSLKYPLYIGEHADKDACQITLSLLLMVHI